MIGFAITKHFIGMFYLVNLKVRYIKTFPYMTVAKYMSLERSYPEKISERINMVMNKLENCSANEEDFEELYIDTTDYHNQIVAAKKRIMGLQSVLGCINGGIKNEQ